MKKGDGMKNGTRHKFQVVDPANLSEVLNEVFGKAHLRASGSDFEVIINFKEKDLIRTLLKTEGHPLAMGMCFWSGSRR